MWDSQYMILGINLDTRASNIYRKTPSEDGNINIEIRKVETEVLPKGSVEFYP